MTFESRNYQVEYEDELRPVQPKRRWLERLLLFGFVLCLLIGLLALTALWSFYQTPTPAGATDPLESLDSQQIVPQLALMQLAGDPAKGLATQALRAGQLETTRAVLVYSLQSGEADQINLLLQLAQRYLEGEAPLPAGQLYQLVRALAILDPTLPSLQRSQMLVQCSAGLLSAANAAAAIN